MKFELGCCISRLGPTATMLIMLVSCAPAAVTPSPANSKPSGKLSARLELLAKSPALRSASAEEQARALSLPPSGPGSLMHDAQGRLLVTIRMTDLAPAQLQALRDAGAVTTNVAQPYRTVTAFVAPADLTAVASIVTVESVMEELTPAHGGGVVGPPTP